jgi:predicted nucleotidyltransferase
MQNLADLTRRLIEARVEFVLVGGFAALSHGVMRSTRDVDICCRFSAANLMRIQKAFADLHPVHFPRTDLPLQLTPEICAELKNLYLKTDLGRVDCLDEVLGIGNFDEVLKNSVELELPAGKCRVISIDALIRAKEAMDRDHDRITVKELKEIKKRQQQN